MSIRNEFNELIMSRNTSLKKWRCYGSLVGLFLGAGFFFFFFLSRYFLKSMADSRAGLISRAFSMCFSASSFFSISK